MNDQATRFWSYVDRSDECWIWRGSRTGLGYGQFYYRGLKPGAHRVAWLLTRGQIPAGLCVLHRCDTPACVNPAHLFLGTRADNTRDMLAKGRNRPASGNTWGRTGKLTPEQVRQARALVADGMSQAAVARRFGVHQTTINQIITGRIRRSIV